MSIPDHYREVERRVEEACNSAGRSRKEITLIAVSKTKPTEQIRELMEIGVADFGENKAQELTKKHEEIGQLLRWHFIGHLQRNKVKSVMGKACLIHSLDSLRLAQELQREAEKQETIVPVLIEVNVAGEITKSGVAPDDLLSLVENKSPLSPLSIRGFMTIAQPVEDPEENRKYFRALRQLADQVKGCAIPGVHMEELSMGMTGDFEVAIEEGATMVRVGTAIFGER